MKNPCFLILDGHNIAYRSFFAIPRLTAPDGRPSNALFGFVRACDALRRECVPSHICAVFDGGLPAERLERLETYKAQRPPMPDELREQMAAIESYLECTRVPALRLEGEEADDVIATLAKQAVADGASVRIASNDKDLYQLVGEGILLVSPTGPTTLVGPEEVRRRTGVGPERIVDWLALTGDASDNIPGVPGIGPKTAARLISEFGSLEELWKRLEEVRPERIRHLLAEYRPQVERNRAMTLLRDDLSLPRDWRSCEITAPDRERLQAFHREWGFHSLLRQMEEPSFL
jgi:DNA polymerase-1